jgi:hypothetical protein
MLRNDIDFFSNIRVFVINSPVMNTPRIHDSPVMKTPGNHDSPGDEYTGESQFLLGKHTGEPITNNSSNI